MVIIAVNCLLAFTEEDTSVKTKTKHWQLACEFCKFEFGKHKKKIKILEQGKFGKIYYSTIWQAW